MRVMIWMCVAVLGCAEPPTEDGPEDVLDAVDTPTDAVFVPWDGDDRVDWGTFTSCGSIKLDPSGGFWAACRTFEGEVRLQRRAEDGAVEWEEPMHLEFGTFPSLVLFGGEVRIALFDLGVEPMEFVLRESVSASQNTRLLDRVVAEEVGLQALVGGAASDDVETVLLETVASATATSVIIQAHDALGNPTWSHQYEHGVDVIAAGLGLYGNNIAYYRLTGDPFAPETRDSTVVVRDRSGELVWSDVLDGDGAEVLASLAYDSDGNLVVCGQLGVDGDLQAWVQKYDSEGVRLWSKTFGGAQDDVCHDVVVGSDNTIIVGGRADATFTVGTGLESVAFVSAFEPDGTQRWLRKLSKGDFSTDLSALDVAETFILAGGTARDGGGDRVGWFSRLDLAGVER